MTLSDKIDFAISHIKSLDLEKIETGKYSVNDFFYYSIQEYNTKPITECKIEAHRKYVDIQYIIKGKELIRTANINTLDSATTYNEEKDCIFYNESSILAKTELSEGSYAVFLTDTAHQPGIAVNNTPSPVKKCVGKVKI